jgi:uncharacterized protein
VLSNQFHHMKKQRSYLAWILLAAFALPTAIYTVSSLGLFKPDEKNINIEPTLQELPAQTPTFVKEGEVKFLKQDGSVLRKIDVEIAQTDAEQMQGLMYRPSMADSLGMLFIFSDNAPRAFWMKNTILPLDIIYVGTDKKIVSIQKNAKPFSEESLPSTGNAQYVVEVNAGLCDKWGVKEGAKLDF